MLHFPDLSDKILAMNKEQRKSFLRNVDLTSTKFEIKIADFGSSYVLFEITENKEKSKKLKHRKLSIPPGTRT